MIQHAIVFLITTLLGGFFMPTAQAAGCGGTMSHQQFVVGMKENIPSATISLLTPEQQLRFMSAFNSIPPITDVNPYKVFVYQQKHAPTLLIEMVDSKGCITSLEQLTPSMMRKMMGVEKATPSV